MKKLVPVLLTAAALLLLGGCSAAVAPVNGGQLSESSGALVIPEYAPVSVTLPNGEPVALSDADSRELLALVSSAEDTGDRYIKGNAIDLFMDTYDECVQWGLQRVKIYILD